MVIDDYLLGFPIDFLIDVDRGNTLLRRPSCHYGEAYGGRIGLIHPLPAGAWLCYRGKNHL